MGHQNFSEKAGDHIQPSSRTTNQLCLRQGGSWSFQTGYIKLEIFLLKNQHTQRNFENFENWISSLQKTEFLKLRSVAQNEWEKQP